MKLIAFTDIHENAQLLGRIKRHAKGVDLAVCTGDFTVFGRSTKKMLAALNDLGVPLVLIPGNHEDDEEIESMLPQFKNIHWAHERFVEVKGLRFFGFGGRGFSRREPALETLEKKFAKQFDDRTIVLCHAPPYDTALDEVDADWHVGNESLRELIVRRKPMLVLTGHIHECFHQHDRLGATILINPGPDGEIIEVDDGRA
jgi:uncharacterized protein